MNLSWSLELLADFYELTMAEGYFQNRRQDDIAYFDLFYRQNPDDGATVFAGSITSSPSLGTSASAKRTWIT